MPPHTGQDDTLFPNTRTSIPASTEPWGRVRRQGAHDDVDYFPFSRELFYYIDSEMQKIGQAIRSLIQISIVYGRLDTAG